MDQKQIEKSLWAFDSTTRTHATVLKRHAAEITAVKASAQAEISQLQNDLVAERGARSAVQKSLDDLRATVDLTGREGVRDLETVMQTVSQVEQAVVGQIRKRFARTSQTVVRDATNRVTEVLTFSDAEPDVCTVRMIRRNAEMRIVGSESVTVPVEDQTS